MKYNRLKHVLFEPVLFEPVASASQAAAASHLTGQARRRANPGLHAFTIIIGELCLNQGCLLRLLWKVLVVLPRPDAALLH
jgi:hypothetical protein